MNIKSISAGGAKQEWVVIDDNGNELLRGTLAEAQVFYNANKHLTIQDTYLVAGNPVNKKRDPLAVDASGTLSGFDDASDVDMVFDDGTRTLTLTAVTNPFVFTSPDNLVFEKDVDSIVLPDTEGLIYVYYDGAGVLQFTENPDRITQYAQMLITLPVSYVLWDAVNKEHLFATRVLKDKTMIIGAYVKNFYDRQIYLMQDFAVSNDPSVGGTVTPTGNVDTDAQFSLSAGHNLFTDKLLPMDAKAQTANWDILYLDSGNVRRFQKTNFGVLQDTDLGAGSGLALYNNDGVPTVAGNNNFVWYFVGISNDIDAEHRVVMFMGDNEFANANTAKDSVLLEKFIVESSFQIRQEFALVYGVLFQTASGYSNGVKSRIRLIENLAGISGAVLA